MVGQGSLLGEHFHQGSWPVAGNPEAPSPAPSMVAPRLLNHTSTTVEDLNPAKVARANGTGDVAAARGAMPPQPLQAADIQGMQAQQGYLLPSHAGVSSHVSTLAPAQHQQQQQQQQLAQLANGAAAASGTQQHPAVAHAAAAAAGAWHTVQQMTAETPPPPPPDAPSHEPSAGGWAAQGSMAEPWQQNQPHMGTAAHLEPGRAFQHEAGSARAQYWSMQRTPGA